MQADSGRARRASDHIEAVDESTLDVFGVGPCCWLSPLIPGNAARHRAWRDALLTAGVAWLPLAILAAVEGHAVVGKSRKSFLLDAGAYARYLVAAPLFVLASAVYLPQLRATVSQFVASGIVSKHVQPDYEALLISTRRLLSSPWTDAVLVGLGYAVTLALSPVSQPMAVTTSIGPAATAPGHLFLAGWWRTLVSQPLFLGLVFAWLWRMLLWTRFLWRVGGMDLRLVAAHPDLLGGLRFVLLPLRGFMILAFAVGAVASGGLADSILLGGRMATDLTSLIGLHVVIVLLVFAGPPLVLTGALLRLQQRGKCTYGRLASQLGREFEDKWLGGDRHVSPTHWASLISRRPLTCFRSSPTSVE